MSFIMSIVSQMWFLVAVLMMCSVSGRGIDNLEEEARGERANDEDAKPMQGQENVVCGQKQIQTSKRDEEKDGLNNHDDSDHLDKILRGNEVTHGDVPWQANYYNNGIHRCGGAIISEYWVLTTASCVYYEHDSHPYVVVGDHRLYESDAGEQRFEIRDVILNELYNQNAADNDIALLKVQQINGRGILFNNYVQPICLPELGERFPDGTMLTVSGWGNDTTVFRRTTDVLNKIVLPVMNQQFCSSPFQPGVITDRMLCVFNRPYAGVCVDDYGGPATYQFRGSHILIGLIAVSSGCQFPESPVVITKVLAHRDWINTVINPHSNSAEGPIPRRIG